MGLSTLERPIRCSVAKLFQLHRLPFWLVATPDSQLVPSCSVQHREADAVRSAVEEFLFL